MVDATLEVSELHKSYAEGRIEALRGVDLTIAAGEYLVITGPSGSGKSTLLHLLGGLDRPTSGEIRFRGSRLCVATDLDSYRAQSVGFVFQAFHLLPTLRAIENVQVPMLALNHPRADRVARAAALLEEMDMGHRADQYPNQLSAGERQRVAVARALANDPEVLLADEPTGNLDSVNSAHIMEILIELQRRRGMTLVVVTHEQEIARSAPRLIRMRDGKVEA
ncbi:MAG: ABC transporter ATP-binding protein [Acidobacteriaceae bacterium]